MPRMRPRCSDLTAGFEFSASGDCISCPPVEQTGMSSSEPSAIVLHGIPRICGLYRFRFGREKAGSDASSRRLCQRVQDGAPAGNSPNSGRMIRATHRCVARTERMHPRRHFPRLCRIAAAALTLAAPRWTAAQTDKLAEARPLVRAERFVDAEAALRQMVQEHADSADAHYLLGYVLFSENKPRPSLAEYAEASRYRPASAA